MRIVWKGRHPEGGQITHVEITEQEVAELSLPKRWRRDLLESKDHPELAKALGVRTKWIAVFDIKPDKKERS